MDITEFITARLAEDEAAAREADGYAPGPWVGAFKQVTSEPGGGQIEIVASTERSAISHYIEHWEPARALREVEAKRAIVEAYRQSRDILMDNRETWDLVRAAVGAQRVTVIRLAAIWPDHPDYRAEWTP